MIKFDRFILANGLKVLVHQDKTTPMAVVNILYDVGARDEDEDKTGFAHLFEHLMFGGSANIPVYDAPLQLVGGENNAFTSNDITNYYITLPSVNLETAFWLESDRMLSLAFSEKSLETQRNVVMEEFKQRYLNQPYGDVWLKLRPLAYKKHPYKWATIGKNLEHIEHARMEDVKAFFKKFYNPANAIMVVGGDVDTEQIRKLSEKWFGDIPATAKPQRNIDKEEEQTESRRETVTAGVPLNGIYITFHAPARTDDDYYVSDIISDILSGSKSSRFYKKLIKEKNLFSEINASISGSIDPGLFIIDGKLLPGITVDEAEKAIWAELEIISSELVNENELQKIKNKLESAMVFSEMNLLDKAMNLAYFELLGDAEQFNSEADRYISVTREQVLAVSNKIFRKENSSTLIYLASENDQ